MGLGPRPRAGYTSTRLLNVQQGHAAAEARPLQNPPEASGSHLPSEGPGKGVGPATASIKYTSLTRQK